MAFFTMSFSNMVAIVAKNHYRNDSDMLLRNLVAIIVNFDSLTSEFLVGIEAFLWQ